MWYNRCYITNIYGMYLVIYYIYNITVHILLIFLLFIVIMKQHNMNIILDVPVSFERFFAKKNMFILERQIIF